MSMLHVKNLNVSYGAIRAVKGISFDVEEARLSRLLALMALAKQPRLILLQVSYVRLPIVRFHLRERA